jgi:hypothetical protein
MWKLAGNGKEQLDLIHLAMAGGLAEKYLPASDKEPFTKWLSMLPANKRRFYEHAAIGNILNAHANELLYDFSPTGQQSAEDEKTAELGIIKVLFQSLTQLDRGRIVRRRATVSEVMDLLNDSSISLEKFNKAVRRFREEGNSFIRPFLSESSAQLAPDTILDITHESLIRNWQIVEQWVLEEDANVQTWHEIEKPLKTWKANYTQRFKSFTLPWERFRQRKYLLPAGLYELYQRWQQQHPPHIAWLKKISPEYTVEHLADFHLFMRQCRDLTRWNKIRPYLLFMVIFYFVFQSQRATIEQAEQAIKHEGIQKELLLRAEKNEQMALRLKEEAEKKEKNARAELENLLKGANINASAERMNIVYIGLDNPVTISVPGFRCEDIEASISHGKLTDGQPAF